MELEAGVVFITSIVVHDIIFQGIIMGTILIVEDDNFLLEALSTVFLRNEATDTILSAPNGKLAARILQSEKVDLVLTDLIMPEINGFELLEYIQTTKPEIPVFVMAAQDYHAEILRSMGAAMFFHKPFKVDEIVNSVNTVFEIFGVDGKASSRSSAEKRPILRLIKGGGYYCEKI